MERPLLYLPVPEAQETKRRTSAVKTHLSPSPVPVWEISTLSVNPWM
jgi:hypothetical protein